MTFPFYIVIGLLVAAVLISMAYLFWVEKVWDYQELDVKTGEVSVIGRIVDPLFPDQPALLVVYREEYPQEPWKLQQALEKKLKDALPYYQVQPVHVSKEPGYNVHRIWQKQKEWAKNTVRNWRSSLFHVLTFPIDFTLRWIYLPVWTMIDFVSHDRRTVAAVAFPPGVPVERSDCRERADDARISIIESFGKVYFDADPPEYNQPKSRFASLPPLSSLERPFDHPKPWALEPPPDRNLDDYPRDAAIERLQKTSGLEEPADGLSSLPSTPARWKRGSRLADAMRESLQ